MFDLRRPTGHEWIATVLADFDSFLVDHAACERKASATGMSFVVRYPDRHEILDDMIDFAREELEHFHQVYRLMEQRGLRLVADRPDHYVTGLITQARSGREARFLDRMLIAGLIEARGCERFGLLTAALPEGDLKDFYIEITRAEARHHGLFLRLARRCFDEATVGTRLRELLDFEGQLISDLPVRAAMH